jgi:hypothetical protein
MIATIAATTADPLGVVQLELDTDRSDLSSMTRRVTRVATLDGSAVFNDFGYSQADRTVRLVWQVASEAQKTAVERLMRLYALITVSLADGLFQAAVESFTVSSGQATLTLLIKSKLSGD